MLRVFEAFSGIGTQRMALRNLGIEHEVVAIAEINKEALLSYSAIHGDMTDEVINSYDKYPCREEMADRLSEMNIGYDFKNNKPYDWHKYITRNNNFLEKHYLASRLSKNLGDISKIATEDIPDHDLFTYSFPCQDISVAGQGKGLDEDSGTRSGLLWECRKVIAVKKPKYLLLENVKNLVGKRHKPNFDKWLEWLEGQGYTNYWQVLNAKDYGIPQNRERVFVVSIFGEHEPYEFPKPVELKLRLKDVLEDEVDERFYINSEKANELLAKLNHQLPNLETSYCIDANYHKGTTIEQFVNKNRRQLVQENLPNTVGGGGLEPKIVASRGRNPDNPSDRTMGSPTEQRLEVNKQGTSNTITSVQKDNLVLEPSNKKHTELPCIFDDRDKSNELKFVGGINDKDWVGDGKEFSRNYPQGNRVYDSEGIACSQTAQGGGIGSFTGLYVTDYRIRKLTPKECWRLMGISDEDFEKAQEVNSNTQLYKQAGNAIVVDVLEGIFRKLFLSKSKDKGNELEEQLEWLDDLLGVGT